jgi:hypothetical protein
MSGQLNTNHASVTNLTTTGQTLYNYITQTSGNMVSATSLTSTGQTLYNLVTGLSGSNNSTFATLTNVTSTGASLYSYITQTSGNMTSASNLTSTGQTLYNYITQTSGSFSAVKVSGSNVISSATFTGIGGTQVTLSGAYVLISGGAGTSSNGSGTNVTISGSSVQSNLDIISIGSISAVLSGSSLVISGSSSTSSGSSTIWKELEINFGSFPVYDYTFSINDSQVSSGSKIIVSSCGKPNSNGFSDEWLWDQISFAAYPNPTGSVFTLYTMAVPGPIQGKRMIQYQIG